MSQHQRIEMADECLAKWCNEAGDHEVHRRYLGTVTAGSGWVIGVNVIQPFARGRLVEFTLMPREGKSQIIPLTADEADIVSKALGQASDFATRTNNAIHVHSREVDKATP